jgi:cell wall-associated NlpC family hydrolase
MASSHRSARFGRVGHRVLLAIAVTSAVALAPLPALAAPEATTSQEAAALVGERAHQLEVVTEQYNDARVALEAKQTEAAQAGEQVVAAEATVVSAREQVREVARSAYTGNSLSTLQAMLSSGSADEVLDRVGTLGTIADHNNDLLAAAQQATEDADAAKAAAEKSAADAQALVDQVAAQQADLNTQIADYQAQYDRLNAAEQEASRAAAERAHAAEAAAAAAAAAESAATSGPSATSGSAAPAESSRSSAPSASAGSSAASSSAGASSASTAAVEESAPVASAGGAAATAVATAMAQRGKPYVWAAAGPGSFDCSGLVQYAYAAAGISLPHSSAAQARAGQAVSRDQLQPGDIIAFYSPVSHVGIYIGNGQMVHAPTSGDVVKVVSIDYMGQITAMRRVG